ncbi:MAG TPA: TIGR01777 family oxidoreductase [Frankiaceae bacterium]|nr:TIGR01777 family oxidoreductase [Frankiaceae bacterium]
MKIAVTGASGLIGSALVPALLIDGPEVLKLVRRQPEAPDEIRWDPARGQLDAGELAGVDAAVHLAGATVGRRWSASYKQKILDSRVSGTRLLATTLAALEPRPRVLISGSAIGFYGDTKDTVRDESGPQGEGFLAEVVRQWEAATQPARDGGIRVATIRTGLVLSGKGGILPPQRLAWKFGLGARIGTGEQWQSWITLDDEIAAIRFLLDADVSGPVNLVAPEPVTQKAFGRALAGALHRPMPWVVPGFALRLALNDFADEGLLIGQRIRPRVLEEAGFTFGARTLDEGLQIALAG